MLTKGERSPKLKPVNKTSHHLYGSQAIPTDQLGAGWTSPWIWHNWLLTTDSEGSNGSLARQSMQGIAQLCSVNLSQRWRLWQCTQLLHMPSYRRFKALRVLWVRYWLKVSVYRYLAPLSDLYMIVFLFGEVEEQGSVTTDAAEFPCTWVCCLISAFSLSPSLPLTILEIRYCFFIFHVLDWISQGRENDLISYARTLLKQSCGFGWDTVSLLLLLKHSKQPCPTHVPPPAY